MGCVVEKVEQIHELFYYFEYWSYFLYRGLKKQIKEEGIEDGTQS